jgi:predicted nucleic acid-binding protein
LSVVAEESQTIRATPVVIDTNVVLDLWLYQDPRALALREALEAGGLQWVATHEMREELIRVLQYAHIQARLAKGFQGMQGKDESNAELEDQSKIESENKNEMELSLWLTGQTIVDHMHRLAHMVDPAPKARFVCKDPDDQKFIDLAQAHQAVLISKDKAVLCMKNRMARLGVSVLPEYVRSSV